MAFHNSDDSGYQAQRARQRRQAEADGAQVLRAKVQLLKDRCVMAGSGRASDPAKREFFAWIVKELDEVLR